MARTVVALFDDFTSASDAVRELVDNGFSRNEISILASDRTGDYSRYVTAQDTSEKVDDSTTSGAGVGAGIGAVIGGLAGILVGLGALTIPGIGPVIAAGPLAAGIAGLAGAGAGAVAGGVTGGLIGALADMGVPEDNAQYFAEGVRRGGTLVTLRTSDEMSNRARDILNNFNPVDMNVRVTEWREEGWTGFDASTSPTMARTERSADVSESEPQVDIETHSYTDYTSFTPNFQEHFSNSMYANTYSYEQYEPAYRYGYDLATNARYRDREWDEIEPEAQKYWDERNPGTWDRIKNAVHHAWEEVKDTVR